MGKLYEDAIRCRKIGMYLLRRLDECSLVQREIAEKLSVQIGNFGESAAYDYLKERIFLEDGIDADHFSSGRSYKRNKIEQSLERLARVFSILEIDSKHESVGLMKLVNPNFKYPLDD